MTTNRTTKGLRDALFGEIEALQGPNADCARAHAGANGARQIINVAKIELEYHREVARQAKQGRVIELGDVELGTIPDERVGAREANADRPNGSGG